MDLCINISIGELLDKLSILELKKNIIKNENKLLEIEKEILVFEKYNSAKNENLFHYNILKWINHQIWLFTDEIKAAKCLDEHFAVLSNKIFNYNQYRFRVKNMLNSKSSIKEQKSYASDVIKIKVDFNSFYSSLAKINKLSVLYDSVIFSTTDNNLIELISNTYPSSNFAFCNEDGDSIDEIVLSDFEDVSVFNFPCINYISGGLLGDFIHQLSVCNETFLKTGRKANIYITDNNLEKFALGAERAHEDLRLILSKQKYINSFELHNGEHCAVNLSIWRHSPLLFRVNWYHIFLDKYNIEWAKHKWITVDECGDYKDVIFLNVSMSRYVSIDYNKLSKKVIFICFNTAEYDGFSRLSGTSFPFYVVKDMDDMFKSIASCYCFIGNLSSPLAFAISMHKYCIGLIGESNDTVHMKDLQIPNYHYYQNENSFTKNVFDF